MPDFDARQRDLDAAIEKFLNYVRENKASVEYTLNNYNDIYNLRNIMAEHGHEMLPQEVSACRMILQIALDRINEAENGSR